MIISSLLDQDFYKFTMGQVVLHNFPNYEVEYKFVCRNNGINFLSFKNEIINEVKNLCNLTFNKDEINYLKQIKLFKKDFIEFLSNLKLNSNFVSIEERNDNLDIRIKGPWLYTIWFEIPLLSIISEIYYKNTYNITDFSHAKNDLITQLSKIYCNDICISDFGTRRRFSKEWHENVIKINKNYSFFKGTSNVYFAYLYNLTPIGTMAHEYLQACQTSVNLIDSQKYALETWAQEYRGELGIALTDVIGVDSFIKDFDLFFAKLYDGVRHDSGDPFVFGNKIIKHYNDLKIDSKTKTIVFSDSLDFNKIIELYNYFNNKIKLSFGIGTKLTNNIPSVQPLNIVIKMIRCNNQPVAKISDSPSKGICEDYNYINYLKSIFNVSNQD